VTYDCHVSNWTEVKFLFPTVWPGADAEARVALGGLHRGDQAYLCKAPNIWLMCHAGIGSVLTSSQVAGMLQGNNCGEMTQLNLGLEQLRSFGSALTALTGLVKLYAQSNCLTNISGKPAFYFMKPIVCWSCSADWSGGWNVWAGALKKGVLTPVGSRCAGLESCSRLQVLNVSNNALASIKGIARLTSLRWELRILLSARTDRSLSEALSL
jgi:hypothetical protein